MLICTFFCKTMRNSVDDGLLFHSIHLQPGLMHGGILAHKYGEVFFSFGSQYCQEISKTLI